MSCIGLIDLGAGPGHEPCAQLGRTPDFEALNKLELSAFEAAIIGLSGIAPAGLAFAMRANTHDFGTYWTLWIMAEDSLPLSATAQRWLEALDVPASWIAAGMPAPVLYDGSQPREIRPLLDLIAGALRITRPGADGSFFPPQNAVIQRNLLAAYGDALATAGLMGPAVPDG